MIDLGGCLVQAPPLTNKESEALTEEMTYPRLRASRRHAAIYSLLAGNLLCGREKQIFSNVQRTLACPMRPYPMWPPLISSFIFTISCLTHHDSAIYIILSIFFIPVLLTLSSFPERLFPPFPISNSLFLTVNHRIGVFEAPTVLSPYPTPSYSKTSQAERYHTVL